VIIKFCIKHPFCNIQQDNLLNKQTVQTEAMFFKQKINKKLNPEKIKKCYI